MVGSVSVSFNSSFIIFPLPFLDFERTNILLTVLYNSMRRLLQHLRWFARVLPHLHE